MDLWSLPGPSEFVLRLRDELASGSSMVVMMPTHGLTGLASRLRQEAGDGWHWTPLEDQADVSPLGQVVHLFESSSEGNLVTITSLLAMKGFAGRILYLELWDGARWSAWSAFLKEFASASRSVAPEHRSVFVLVLWGIPRSQAAADDVALRMLVWEDVVSEVDLYLHASIRLRRLVAPVGKRNLLALTAARIALWDLDLTDRLLESRPEDIIAPQPVLDELARDRGWTVDTPIEWHLGTQGVVDGVPTLHSAIAHVHAKAAELSKRIWSAQASVILPLIEERRLALLARLKGHIKVPVEVDGERVGNLADLEIGHLAYLASSTKADGRTKARVRRLRDIRNRLAHLEVLETALAWHDDLYHDG